MLPLQKYLSLFIIFGYICLSAHGCTYHNLEELFQEKSCITEEVSFQKDILPIFHLRCNNNVCHGGPFPQGRVSLTSFAGVIKVAEDGRLAGAINHLPGFNPMPVDSEKLSECEIEKIQTWINEGAADN